MSVCAISRLVVAVPSESTSNNKQENPPTSTSNTAIAPLQTDTIQQALELADVVVSGLAARPLPPYLRPECRVVDLSARRSIHCGQSCVVQRSGLRGGDEAGGKMNIEISEREQYLGPEYRRSLRCPNLEETNSAIEVSFQVCCVCVRERARKFTIY